MRPLHHVATEGAQTRERLLRLDAFGHDLEPEIVREVDGGAHDLVRIAVRQHVEHE